MKNTRDYNVGKSDYAQHKIQPWDIILEYGLNYWDGDIIKRILRTKEGESRRLDYEKIIHICNERIRQIDVENAEVGEDEDGTSVFCPTESYMPAYHAEGRIFDVYSVFENDGHYFAYVGYNYKSETHMYLSLTDVRFAMCEIKDFPLPYAPFPHSIDYTEHSESLKIGALGVEYGKYDYLINEGKLYRFMGWGDVGKLFKYARFMGGNDIDFIEIPYKLRNYANQITCEK